MVRWQVVKNRQKSLWVLSSGIPVEYGDFVICCQYLLAVDCQMTGSAGGGMVCEEEEDGGGGLAWRDRLAAKRGIETEEESGPQICTDLKNPAGAGREGIEGSGLLL